MKKKSLRILSLIVAIVMVVAMLPLSALAEETGPKRKVGVVVYGAELTAVLTDIESALHGNVDLEASLKQIVDVATKVADGTGVSVPNVDVTLTDENGKSFKMEEDRSVEIFTDTTEMYIGFQEEVDKQLTKLESDLTSLKNAMAESNKLTQDLVTQITEFEEALENIRNNLNDLKHKLVGAFNDLKDPNGNPIVLNGILYRTYVTEEAVPANASYTVKVERFSDTDKDGNAVTRDGYVLYNDGLESGGSKFNTYRSFSVDVKEQGRFDHEIQFVGPLAGIEGTLNLPESFGKAYDIFANAMNKMAKTAEDVKKAATDSSWFDHAATLISDIAKIGPIYDWFKEWTAPTFSTYDEISKEYRFGFPGLWCAELDAGFTFRNVDVKEQGIEGSDFLLINRQELIDVLKFMKDLGKDAFQGALKATFGGEMTYADGTVMTYEGITELYTQLLEMNEEGQISLNYDTAYAIVKTYLGVIMDMHLINRVVEFPEGLGLPKLKYPIPAILKATSDENGLVEFKKSSNITLRWIIDLIPEITKYAAQLVAPEDNNNMVAVMNALQEFIDSTADFVGDAINILVYPFAQRLGLVGPKLASGQYIMFQTKAPDDYMINPIAYTMDISWDNNNWIYTTVADMGLIGPYFAEEFFDFVRDTTFAGTVDQYLSEAKGEKVTVLSDILNGKIDVTKKTNEVAMAALTAFTTQLGFEAIGADKLFATKSELISDLNQYLLHNGQTAQNLVVYLNRLAMRSKTGYTGKVDDGWYFYNVNKSPTTTATKLINKATTDLVNATAVEIRKPVVQKAGDTVQTIVEKVGTRIETNVKKVQDQIKNSIGQAIKNVAQKAIDSVKTSIVNFFKGLFA